MAVVCYYQLRLLNLANLPTMDEEKLVSALHAMLVIVMDYERKVLLRHLDFSILVAAEEVAWCSYLIDDDVEAMQKVTLAIVLLQTSWVAARVLRVLKCRKCTRCFYSSRTK